MTTSTETAILAGGCFWCTEAVYDAVRGVTHVESGYIGGPSENPSYEAVCSGRTGHAEAVKVEFDPAEISFAEILDIFFVTHNPTTLNRQGGDSGTQYRSAIFPLTPEQSAETNAAIARHQENWPDPIVTTIEPQAPWYVAEPYHQRYFEKNGTANGYCAAVIAPKLSKFRKAYAERLKQ
jgi:peptide-methionine (S)-S-oxide reductase